ncbi:MAG TPA: AcvB/VirJ family lysyl-phosphatidylglycerol hydrolase [Gemmatimonadaceae bacterium]|nr:AcvB/VirJ family lysyl-phosphatidylglycerol hydrolase [Gemmatimonadaceae bacterium]
MGRALGTGVVFAALVAALMAAAVGSRAHPVPAAVGADTVDLPLHEVAARGTPSRTIAVFLSGDGGWAAIDRELADSLAVHGIAVVGLDSRTYFSTQREPDGASRDLAWVAHRYLARFAADSLILIGYSRGADVLPFMTSRLPSDLQARVRLVALLGIAPNANFKFHLMDLISNKRRKDDLMTVPEVEKVAASGMRVLCVYGTDEKESACPSLATIHGVTVAAMPGGHHFDKAYGVIGSRLLDAAH